MKMILFSFLLLLMGCQSTPVAPSINTLSPSPEATLVEYALESNDTFQFNEQCPHGCWLGINPGTTTAAEAKAILQASNQIDKQDYTEFDKGIDAVWKPDNFNTPCQIHVWFGNGLGSFHQLSDSSGCFCGLMV